MLDSSYLLPFDLFQELVTWLGTSMETYRKGRRLLESNQNVLLRTEIERELERLISAHVEEKVEMKQKMQHHQELLRTARQRGGSSTAIREAYINVYGGFALDLPDWLEKIEWQRAQLVSLRRPERTTRTQILLLREGLAQAQENAETAPEIVAELSNELGHTLLLGSLPRSHAEHLHLIEEAIAYHKSAISVYTYARYPLQYARTCIYLGTAYQRYSYLLDSQEAIERTLTYYKSALCIYNRTEYPEQWGLLQTLLGNAYTQRHTEDMQKNLDYAIACHEKVLAELQEDTYSEIWARALVNLGDAYQLYEGPELTNKLHQALNCYRTAQRVYTQQAFPHEWADIHTKLAGVFQKLASQRGQQQETALGSALVCYEVALKVYTLDAYPIEYAATQFRIGEVHACRTSGERSFHLKQALQCYKEALHIFTLDSFPAEHQQVSKRLAEAEAASLATTI